MTFLAGELFAVISIAAGLLATPLVLRWLGDEQFGAFRVTSDWYGHLALFELGLGGAILPLLAEAIARQDAELVRQTLAAGVKAYFRASFGMIAGGLGLAAIITWLVPVGTANANDLRRACIVCVLGMAFVPLAPFRALVEAQQRGYRVSVLLVLHSLLVTGLAVAMARAKWGISGQCLAVLFAGVAFRLILACDALREFSGLLAASIKRAPEPEVWRRLWNLNWPTLIFDLASRISLLTDNIIVAGLLGASSVVPFFVTQRLTAVAQRELQGIGNASWAGLAELHAQGDLRTFNQRLIDLTMLVTVLGVACMVPLAAFNRHFVALWVGPARYGGGPLTAIASVDAILLAAFSLWGWCVSGTGQIGEMTGAMVIQSIINLILSVLLTRRCGVIGPVLGTLIAFVAVSCWYLPLLLRRLFGTSLKALIGAIAAPVELGLPYAAIVWRISEIHEPKSLFVAAFEIAAAASLYLASWWLVVLKRPERARWAERIGMLPGHVAAN